MLTIEQLKTKNSQSISVFCGLMVGHQGAVLDTQVTGWVHCIENYGVTSQYTFKRSDHAEALFGRVRLDFIHLKLLVV
jgi:hypothetical protein